LAAVINKSLGVLKVFVARDRLAVQAALVKRCSVGGGNYADLAGRNYSRFID
jgi:hypothetical protein